MSEGGRGRPRAEVAIDESRVRVLLVSQHPDLATLPIRALGSGWDNASFRIGSDLVARLPRRAEAVPLILHEQRWLPQLASSLPIAVPVPVRTGVPGDGYPWAWSLVSWFEGATADHAPLASTEPHALADFLRALHRPAPPSAPHNPHRGIPLSGRARDLARRWSRLRAETGSITTPVERAWSAALEATANESSVWLHGDLHPRNVIVRSGCIVAVIDWGDLTSGDPATDLASIWMLLGDRADRLAALDRYQASPALRARALGWAVVFGSALLDAGLADSDAGQVEVGRLTLARIEDDFTKPGSG